MEDALSSLLRDVRPVGALVEQSPVRSPWSLRYAEESPLTLLTMLSGNAWVIPDEGAAVAMNTGDVVIVVGSEPFTVADDPGTAPLVMVLNGECVTLDGEVVEGELAMCDYDGDPSNSTVLLKSTYRVHGSVSQRVLAALPRVARVPAVPEGCPTLTMIASEIRRDAPGQRVILDRLLDLLLVSSLREWFELPQSQAPAWYRAHADPLIGRALRLIHDDPARAWTVAGLARAVGASRATFAQRFTELVGQPPMAYLTEWRICQAADLLARSDATVDSVARQVGYSNAYALSVAFKRTLGIPPGRHRALARS
ncbi:cupin domain-containing protein [Spirillospora sp. CA-294931]|uniref:AraC family transcriptional regulator n=1 Tax=Spirillospora sp. CA-294931 TaxID=3240042 RepID=UPI003D8A2CFB